MKDNDFKFLCDTGKIIVEISTVDKLKILDAIKADTYFLLKMGIMDYSLLLAIEDTQFSHNSYDIEDLNFLK